VVPPGRLQVVRIDAPDRGWAADVTMADTPQELRATSFTREVGLGPARAKRGPASQPGERATRR